MTKYALLAFAKYIEKKIEQLIAQCAEIRQECEAARKEEEETHAAK